MTNTPYGRNNSGRTIRERLAWIVIYLNIPLLIAVVVLCFAFWEWGIVRILLVVDIALILFSYIFYRSRPKKE